MLFDSGEKRELPGLSGFRQVKGAVLTIHRPARWSPDRCLRSIRDFSGSPRGTPLSFRFREVPITASSLSIGPHAGESGQTGAGPRNANE